MAAAELPPIDLQPIPHIPWEVLRWKERRAGRRVGRLNGAIALVEGDVVRMFASLTAACAAVSFCCRPVNPQRSSHSRQHTPTPRTPAPKR
jgi:hypothetical protein